MCVHTVDNACCCTLGRVLMYCDKDTTRLTGQPTARHCTEKYLICQKFSFILSHIVWSLNPNIALDLSWNILLFKESALWADSFYKSKCPYVCLFVCLFVRHTFSLRLTVFLPPLPEVQCPNFLDIRNPWGKVMERSGLRFENFCS